MKTLSNTNRRTFIKQLVMASVACGMPLPLLQSCKGKTDTFYQGTGMSPFRIWEEMLMAIRTSPDFHEGKVEELIATKDAEAMFNYVRDGIVLLPATEKLNKESHLLKHGMSGVLRTGMATAREKADLLLHMYTQAGIEAQIVNESTDFTADSILKCYTRNYENGFNPKVSKAQLKKWQKELDATSDVDLNNNIGEQAEKLAEQLLSAIEIDEEKLKKNSIKDGKRTLPTVKFTIDGVEQYAHLVDPKVPFGSLRNKDSETSTRISKSRKFSDKVTINLWAHDSIEPGVKRELLSAKWDMQDLVGRQLNISFLKDLKIGSLSTDTISQFDFFTPAFALQGVDDELSFLQENSYVGDPITIFGEQIILDEANEESLFAKLKYEAPVDVNSIDKIECTASTPSFPKVRLKVFAKDAAGELVEGLQPSNFMIKEDGNVLPALLKRNRKIPRILILSDSSLSMPAIYRGEGIKKFNENLEQLIRQDFPDAKIDFWKVGSHLYKWMAKASQQSVDLILFCTDGDVYDKLNEANIPLYKAGAPALILDVLGAENEHFNTLAELTRGQVIPAEDQEQTMQAVVEYLAQVEPSPYVLEYNSRSRDKHEVEVSIVDTKRSATDNYEFPKASENEGGLISLGVDIWIGYAHKTVKVLAGANKAEMHNLIYSHPIDRTIKSLRNQVRGFLMGGAKLYIESEGPTLGVALADVLKAQLTNRAWGEAFLQGEMMEAKEKFEEGAVSISGSILSLLTQPQNAVTEKSLTYVGGYRMAMAKTVWPIEDEPGSSGFDYFQTSDYKTLGKNSLQNFKDTAAVTAQLAIRENILFPVSTLSSLDGKQLLSASRLFKSEDQERIDSTRKLTQEKNLYRTLLYNGSNYTIFDESLESLSYWKIKKATGEIYGILPDGTGGGSVPIDPSLADATSTLLNIVGILERALTIATGGALLANPLGGLSLAVVAKYGVTLAKIYGLATQSIVVMDTTGLSENIKKELQVLACEVYKEIVFTLYGNAGAMFSGVESLIGLMSPKTKSPFSCS